MGSLKLFNEQARRFAAVGALLFATLMPALAPALVSAATITERSVALSTSAKGAAGVSYTINFKAKTDATGAFVVDFCNSAVVGTACTTPSGLSTSGVTTSGSDTVTAIKSNTAVKVVLNTPADVDDTVSVALTGIHNPTNAGPLYARIITYTNDTDATGYTDVDPDTVGDHLDEGTVALSITDNIGVSGSVLESLIFCATDNASTISTGCTGTLGSPTVVLGAGGVLGTTTSTGTIKTQISTNAAHGAVVSLKNSTAGGGLKRAEASTSDITPFDSAAATIPDNSAKVGLKLAGLGAATGTVNAAGSYSTSNFYLGYASNNSTGVTSTYGDPIYNTNNAPINDGTANLTFGANISNVTPAGTYSATLSLIATGTF